MKLLGPKRTFASVVRELVEGFERGTVVLRADESPKGLTLADILGPEVRAWLRTLRRLTLAGVGCGLLFAVAGVAMIAFWGPPYPLAVQGTLLVLALLHGAWAGYVLQQRRFARRLLREAEDALKRVEAVASSRMLLDRARTGGGGPPGTPPGEPSSEVIVDEAVGWLRPLGELPEPLKRRVLGELSRRVQAMAESAPKS